MKTILVVFASLVGGGDDKTEELIERYKASARKQLNERIAGLEQQIARLKKLPNSKEKGEKIRDINKKIAAQKRLPLRSDITYSTNVGDVGEFLSGDAVILVRTVVDSENMIVNVERKAVYRSISDGLNTSPQQGKCPTPRV